MVMPCVSFSAVQRAALSSALPTVGAPRHALVTWCHLPLTHHVTARVACRSARPPGASALPSVYTVAGSTGKLSNAALDHPAHVAGFVELGSVLIEAGASEMTATFINDKGAVLDYVTITR